MHEPILIGTMGRPSRIKAFPSMFDGVAREHSRKPEAFYALVEKHTAGLRRCDIFSREQRQGWDSFGDQLQRFGVPA